MGNNHHVDSYSSFDTQGLVKAGLVTALYVVITMFVAPVAYGPIQFRISEGLNFMGLYNKRWSACRRWRGIRLEHGRASEDSRLSSQVNST